MSVVEVIAAFVVFLLVLIPFAALLTHADSVQSNTQNAVTANGILNSQLADAQTSTFPGTTWNVKTTTTPAWPATPTATTKMNTYTFSVYEVGGWCVLTATSKQWGNGIVTTAPPTYHVIAKVVWLRKATASTTTEYVRDSTEMPETTDAPANHSVVSSCPLGLK